MPIFGTLAAYSMRSGWIIARRGWSRSSTPTAVCSVVMPNFSRSDESICSSFACNCLSKGES